jgi:hypothetical protein
VCHSLLWLRAVLWAIAVYEVAVPTAPARGFVAWQDIAALKHQAHVLPLPQHMFFLVKADKAWYGGVEGVIAAHFHLETTLEPKMEEEALFKDVRAVQDGTQCRVA